MRGQPIAQIIGFFAQFDPANALLFAAACNSDTEIDDGEIDATFAGPQFGVRAAPYLAESKAGVWAIKFRIERDEGDAAP